MWRGSATLGRRGKEHALPLGRIHTGHAATRKSAYCERLTLKSPPEVRDPAKQPSKRISHSFPLLTSNTLNEAEGLWLLEQYG